jgi:hypothetical protein
MKKSSEKNENITKREQRKFVSMCKRGIYVPEDFPGEGNQAFRMLIRALRS